MFERAIDVFVGIMKLAVVILAFAAVVAAVFRFS